MRAALYNGVGQVVVEERVKPVPGPGDVLLRNLYAGVCGSDVSVYRHGPEGHQVSVGDEFGHEMVSEVAAVGSEVKHLHVGERVYPYPLLAGGGPHKAGMLGGFSEYILVENAQVDEHIYRVNEVIAPRAAALIEPFTVAHNGVRAASPQNSETAIVFGAGTIGIGAAVALKSYGVSDVLVVDLSDFRLQKASELGFHTVHGAREDLRERASELFGTVNSLLGEHVDVDVFVDAAGADQLIGTYQGLGKAGSRMVVIGVHYNPVPVDLQKLAFGAQALIGSGGYGPEDVRAVLSILESGRFDLESIVSHVFPLERIVEAIETAGDRDRTLQVMIEHST